MNSGLQSRAPKDPWTRVIVVSEDCPADIIFSHRSWRPTDFNIMKTLFVGKRSVIYRAVVHGTAVPLVLKVYVKNRLAAVHRKQVEREIQIHSAISHENIIKMYGAFEDTDHVYLLLESAGKVHDRRSLAGPRPPTEPSPRPVLWGPTRNRHPSTPQPHPPKSRATSSTT